MSTLEVRPPAEHAHRMFHKLVWHSGEAVVWRWHKPGVWMRAGKSYLPAHMVNLGWRYVSAVVPDMGTPAPPAPIPEGVETMINRDGRPVPAHLVPSKARLEDQTVRELLRHAAAMHMTLAAFKTQAFADIEAFMELLSAAYNVQMGGRSGGTTLESYDGLMKVSISSANTLTFGPELKVAEALIGECVSSWSEGANEHLRILVMDAFKVAEGGNLRIDRVLGLRSLAIEDDKWRQAMLAIGDAIRVAHSKRYIRFYQRLSQDAEWQQIVLDASRV